jgi:hypothetical protein
LTILKFLKKNTMKKILWLLAILLLIANVVILNLFIFTTKLPTDTALVIKSSLQAVTTITFYPLVLSVFASFFPFKGWNYIKKWSWYFPILLIIASLFFLSKNGIDANKIQSSNGKFISKWEYEAIEPNAKLNCDQLKQGTFETAKVVHIREERREIQLIKSTNRNFEFGIHWINDCEFFLNAYYQGSENQAVKITGIGQNSYDCVVLKGNIAKRFKVKIKNESMD